MIVLFGRYPRIVNLLIMMSNFYQKIYDKIVESLLSYKFTKGFVLLYFRFLFLFREKCMELGKRYTQLELNCIALLIATVASRLKFAGTMITFSLIIVYFEMHFQNMAKFYRRNPTLLVEHFPDGQDPKRGMHRFTQAVIETFSNPVVASVATATAGAVGWKALEVHQVNKENLRADKDRDAAALQGEKDREAEANQRQLDREAARETAQLAREAEYQRHKETLEAAREATAATIAAEDRRAQLAREAEDQRHKEILEAEDRRYRDSLEIENAKNRESRMYTNYTNSSEENTPSSTEIVD